MNRFLPAIIALTAAAFVETAAAGAHAQGMPDLGPAAFRAVGSFDEAASPPSEGGVLLAQQADCSAAAAQAAAETGAQQVLTVSTRGEGNQTECVIQLLVPDPGGGPPQRETVTRRP